MSYTVWACEPNVGPWKVQKWDLAMSAASKHIMMTITISRVETIPFQHIKLVMWETIESGSPYTVKCSWSDYGNGRLFCQSLAPEDEQNKLPSRSKRLGFPNQGTSEKAFAPRRFRPWPRSVFLLPVQWWLRRLSRPQSCLWRENFPKNKSNPIGRCILAQF